MWPDLLALCPMEVLTNSHFSVKFEDGLRVILEYFESVSDGLWFVVVSLHQRLPGLVILALYLGRVEHEVVDTAAGGVDPPVLHSLNDGFERDTKVDNDIDRCLLLQCFGLSHCPAGDLISTQTGGPKYETSGIHPAARPSHPASSAQRR